MTIAIIDRDHVPNIGYIQQIPPDAYTTINETVPRADLDMLRVISDYHDAVGRDLLYRGMELVMFELLERVVAEGVRGGRLIEEHFSRNGT